MLRASDPASTTPEAIRRKKILVVLLGLLLVSALHFVTRTNDPVLHAWHIFFRKLYFIPIVAAAVWFGLRGAILTALAASGSYALYLMLNWSGLHLERMNQVGEMASFLVFAGVAEIGRAHV